MLIPVGTRTAIGIIVEKTTKPDYPTKAIEATYESPLPTPLIDTARWLSSYYCTHFAHCLQLLVPRGITKRRRANKKEPQAPLQDLVDLPPTQQQAQAIQTILSHKPTTTILHGVTGSGKTTVYMHLARDMQQQGKSTIILVPEITLTAQLVAHFQRFFTHIIVSHSQQTEAERHRIFREVQASAEPVVIIGARSALFLPVANLGLVVVDEFHEPSFKQESMPRYSALRAASVLARNHHAYCIFGSATPPISDMYIAEKVHTPVVKLTSTARPLQIKPTTVIVPFSERTNFTSHPFISNELLHSLKQNIQQKTQSLIFHNRRGSAPLTICQECGWQALCPHCHLPLTLHTDTHQLVCHLCGFTTKIPYSCPTCGAAEIVHKGIGTKRIEAELKRLLPEARVQRFDADTEQDKRLNVMYDTVARGDIDILIGTQMIAKGLDLPLLRTVGIIQADSGLSLPDFTSSERTFQLLSQAVGRVGRSDEPSKVIAQTYQPDHPAVRYGLAQDYASFYTHEITRRERDMFPPFCYLLAFICSYKTEQAAIKNAQKFHQTLLAAAPSHVHFFGPTPAFHEQLGDSFRWQIIVKSPQRADLQRLVSLLPPSHWQYELDPANLLF